MQSKFVQIMVSLILFVVIIEAMPHFQLWWNSQAKATDWFEVNQFHVGDFEVGKAPLLIYEREIKKRFRAKKITQLQEMDIQSSPAIVCQNSEDIQYSPEDVLPEILTIDWFMGGKPCHIPSGVYRFKMVWVIHLPGYPEMEYEYISNIFQVRDVINN